MMIMITTMMMMMMTMMIMKMIMIVKMIVMTMTNFQLMEVRVSLLDRIKDIRKGEEEVTFFDSNENTNTKQRKKQTQQMKSVNCYMYLLWSLMISIKY